MNDKLHLDYEVVTNTKEDVAGMLMCLADNDLDFNGENGDEYLWDEALGFESNAAYCLSIAKKEKTPSDMIEKFISLWMGRDYYYQDYRIGIHCENNTLFVSLAYITE